jgi:hypothetical protein
VVDQVLKDCGASNLRMRSIIILFILVIAAGAAVGQDADDLRTVIPRLHGQPEMVRNIAGQWEAAVIVYRDAEVELSVPAYLLVLCPIFCTSWIVSVAQLLVYRDSCRMGCGELGIA